MRRITYLVALVAAVVGSTACGDDGPRPSGAEEPTGEIVEVDALDNTFRNDRVEIAPGTEVRFVNAGRNDHDVEPAAGAGWGVGDTAFAPGDVYSQVFTQPGMYPYYCTLHGTSTSGMVGTIVVEDEDAARSS